MGGAAGAGVSEATGLPMMYTAPVGAAIALSSVYVADFRGYGVPQYATAAGLGGLISLAPIPVPKWASFLAGTAASYFALPYLMQPIYGDGAGYVLENTDLVVAAWNAPQAGSDTGLLGKFGVAQYNAYKSRNQDRKGIYWF